MAGSPAEVLEFLHDLAARAKPVAQKELARLREFAHAELKLDNLESWDVGYASEKLRQQQYALDEEQLKPYFPLPAVIDGLFGLTTQLYGITLAAREGVDVWHPDVRYYDVRDADGRVFAGAYVDLYARNGKRGGAWMDVCRARFDDDSFCLFGISTAPADLESGRLRDMIPGIRFFRDFDGKVSRLYGALPADPLGLQPHSRTQTAEDAARQELPERLTEAG